MEMSKHGKNYNSNKFIIKPKPTLAHIRSENIDPEPKMALESEVDLFLAQMSQKSKRFKDLLQEKNIENEEEFCQNQLFRSVCLKTILRTILDRMLSERRLGRNLKGLNKGNMIEIQNQIWSNIIREIELYKNDRDFRRQRDQLKQVLTQRKQQILQQLQKLKSNEDKLEKVISV